MSSHCYFIATGFADNPIPLQFRALASELVERGHRVVLLVSQREKSFEDHESNPSVYAWPSIRPTKFKDFVFLHRLVRRYRPDCLIGNFGAVNVMMVVGWLTRVPCRVAWVHTLSTQIDLDNRLPRWKLRLLRLRKGRVYNICTHIVANSEATHKDAQQVYGVREGKCQVLHNLLADPADRQDPAEPRLRSQNRVVCVGRLHQSKGQDTLVRAIALVGETFPDTCVEFVGRGPFQEAWVGLAEELGVADRCIFSGSVPHNEVLRKMALAAFTVVPSRSEAFGLINIESMSVGTPVVASRVGGIPEIIRDGVDGFLVPPDDPEALAEKLKVLLSDPELRERMGRNARKRFLEKFELSRNIGRHADFFEQIVEDALRRRRQRRGVSPTMIDASQQASKE